MERLTPVYFMSTVGGDEEQILKYVQWQGRQDEVQTKLDLPLTLHKKPEIDSLNFKQLFLKPQETVSNLL